MGLFGGIAEGLKKFNTVNPESGLSWADRLGGIGGVLQGDPNALANTRALGQQRQMQQQQNQALSQAAGLFGGSPGAQVATKPRMGPTMDEGLAPQQPATPAQPQVDFQTLAPHLLKLRQLGVDTGPLLEAWKVQNEPQRSFYNTGQGIVSVDKRTGQTQTLYTDPPKAPTAPAGYRFGTDSASLEFIPGGPADPKIIGGQTGARRDAIVARPLPKRASGGRSASALPPPPGGWKKAGG